ncbi:MAG: hypothetical protein K0A98_16565 [Trueperaceae bacterium]|nr:hypothetical protein [Trueperaceae bacterium]
MGKFPFAVMVCGILGHSREARDGHMVVSCQRCGAVHELMRVEPEEPAA